MCMLPLKSLFGFLLSYIRKKSKVYRDRYSLYSTHSTVASPLIYCALQFSIVSHSFVGCYGELYITIDFLSLYRILGNQLVHRLQRNIQAIIVLSCSRKKRGEQTILYRYQEMTVKEQLVYVFTTFFSLDPRTPSRHKTILSYSPQLLHPAGCLHNTNIQISIERSDRGGDPTPFEGGKPVASTAVEDVDVGLLQVS